MKFNKENAETKDILVTFNLNVLAGKKKCQLCLIWWRRRDLAYAPRNQRSERNWC
jgi:hypothetical protein